MAIVVELSHVDDGVSENRKLAPELSIQSPEDDFCPEQRSRGNLLTSA
jgi:hypothetical protein